MESTAQQIGVRDLLEAGVHFGHQAKRWNPKMKKFIFAERAGVHIIDLDQTITLLDRAVEFARTIGEAGREVLFVGTKKQAQLTIAEQAMRSGQPYVAERYIGGMLTNFQTIHPRIQYFKDLAVRVDETPEENQSGKEWFAMTREFQKLRRNFAGLTEMERLPGAIFVIDPKREELLVKEANRLKIPVIALTDTNCDPEAVDYIIPGNDDAIRAINLISRLMADALLMGKGEDEVHPEERLVPPVVEEARVAEEISAENAASANGTSGDAAPAVEAVAEPAEFATPEPAPEIETADVTVSEDSAEVIGGTETTGVAEEPVAEPVEPEDAPVEEGAIAAEPAPEDAVTQSEDATEVMAEAVAEGEESTAEEAPAEELAEVNQTEQVSAEEQEEEK
ncbi:MAG: 30S ribosomal protein S2 [Rubrobacter sp.]|nr:30S ribosomal protein S2 [Rubrobacter sp.]